MMDGLVFNQSQPYGQRKILQGETFYTTRILQLVYSFTYLKDDYKSLINVKELERED